MILNNRNGNNFNNCILKNYFHNQNYSDFNNNNYDENKNNNSNLEQKYLDLLNEQKKEDLNNRNKINIYEENTKFINSRKTFKFKKAQISSKQNTFDKEISQDKISSLNKINTNVNRNIPIMKILKQYKKINSTLNEKELLNQKDKYNLLLNIKNKIKDDEKYVKFKKEIFEKASTILQGKIEKVKEINSKIKKMKNLSKKFMLKKPLIVKALLKENSEIYKENSNIETIKANNRTINYDLKYNKKKNKDNSNKSEELVFSNKNNLDNNNNNINSKRNKTISYKFNEEKDEKSLSDDLYYFDISKLKNNSQIPKEYLNIIYHNLLFEENKGINPMPDYEKIISQKDINSKMRSILIDWIIDVHYNFGLTDETLFMTILIIDRYISSKQISKLRFQLLGITAMLLSCKHEEIILPKIEDFIYLTDHAYKKQDVIDMENNILDTFNFDLIFPSAIKFYEYLALNFGFDRKKFLIGKYLMESFMVDLNWVKYRASVIACSCVYIVMKYYKMENYRESYDKKFYNFNTKKENNTNYRNEYDIKNCAKDICFFVDNINKTKYLSCKNKYANKNFEKVSLIISGELL